MMKLTKKQIREDFERRRNTIEEIYGKEGRTKMYLKEMLRLILNVQMEILK